MTKINYDRLNQEKRYKYKGLESRYAKAKTIKEWKEKVPVAGIFKGLKTVTTMYGPKVWATIDDQDIITNQNMLAQLSNATIGEMIAIQMTGRFKTSNGHWQYVFKISQPKDSK